MARAATFYTYRPSFVGVDDVRATLLPIIADKKNPSAKLAEIDLRLAEGHAHYHKRRYPQALTSYRAAEAAMYALLEPRFDPRTVLGSDVRLPLERALFQPLLETVVTAARVAPPEPRPVTVGPATAVATPQAISPLLGLGVLPHVVSAGLAADAVEGIRTATELVRAGQPDEAVPLLERSLESIPDDNGVLRAEVTGSLALALAAAGRRNESLARLEDARATFATLGHTEGLATVEHARASVESAAPGGNGRIADATRELTTATGGLGEAAAAAAGVLPEEARLTFTPGLDEQGIPLVVSIPLAAEDAPMQVLREVYDRRVRATTLEELGVNVPGAFLPGFGITHVPHHYFFTIQLCLGDTYRRLGNFVEAVARYERARDYEFLNQALEAPVVWLRLAECILEWGRSLYARNQFQPALDQFRRIVEVTPAGARSIPATAPLYASPAFAAISAAAGAYIADPDAPLPEDVTAEMAVVLRRAAVYQDMLHAGLNLLGMPVDLVPVFRFRYLQAVARYFAEQAIKAEREYVSFMSSSEQEQASHLQLQQAADLADAAVVLEQRRLDEAAAERAVAEASRSLAQERVENAQERMDEYAQVSADRVALDTATAHASGGFTETEGGYSVSLSTTGENVNLGDEDYEIMRSAAWHRGMINREFELNDMARTKEEYEKHRAVANAQVALSEKRQAVALENHAIAVLRQQHAQEMLDFSESKVFGAELWHALADRMREISQLYLERAIEIALMMQAAYNFETDSKLDKIAASYETSPQLEGLLGGNALLADIDYFTYHHVTQTKAKEIPVKTVLSLAEHFPFSLFQLRRTGTATFETSVELLDRMYPGAYLHRLQAVEVVVEGVVPATGINGAISNTGVAVFRTRDNKTKVRLQPMETLLLSSFTLRGDAVVFRPSDEVRGVFEDTGAATAWTLTIPPGSNDLRYETISDVKVVLHHTAFHDRILEQQVRAALPAKGKWSRILSLRESRPDAFFLLVESGAAQLDVGAGDLPFHHVSPVTTRLSVFTIADGGGPAAGVTVDLDKDGAEARIKTDAAGTAVSGGTPLDAFTGETPNGIWSVELPKTENESLFVEDPPGSGVHRVRGLRDVLFAIDYDYDVRTT
ncbi:MAG TPA: hypothetical protein VHI71_10720 [Actinomycetota bacterium]|nr:hypothetical protein [Actinomycetota bacterium]